MPKSKNLYHEILVMVAGFLLLFIIFDKNIFLYISVAVAVLTSFSKFIAEKINWLWWKLALVLGWISSRILLSIVYFFFLTPIAFFFRLTHKNHLQLHRKNEGSYYINRGHVFTKKDLEKMW